MYLRVQQWLDLIYEQQSAKIFINGQESERILIGRGVHQGWPLSPLLFNMVIKTLAIVVRSDNIILGVKVKNFQTKLCVYADGVVFILRSLERSLEFLNLLLGAFSAVSGYKINEKKSVMLGSNIDAGLREFLRSKTKALWKQRGVRYFGIKISDSLTGEGWKSKLGIF